jgi:hypothetical protein
VRGQPNRGEKEVVVSIVNGHYILKKAAKSTDQKQGLH